MSSPSEDAFQPSGKVPKALDVAPGVIGFAAGMGSMLPPRTGGRCRSGDRLDRFSDRRDFDDPTASL